jgi:hypothetical protein
MNTYDYHHYKPQFDRIDEAMKQARIRYEWEKDLIIAALLSRGLDDDSDRDFEEWTSNLEVTVPHDHE